MNLAKVDLWRHSTPKLALIVEQAAAEKLERATGKQTGAGHTRVVGRFGLTPALRAVQQLRCNVPPSYGISQVILRSLGSLGFSETGSPLAAHALGHQHDTVRAPCSVGTHSGPWDALLPMAECLHTLLVSRAGQSARVSTAEGLQPGGESAGAGTKLYVPLQWQAAISS